MSGKGHEFAGNERVSLLVAGETQWRALEQCSQIERSESVENDDLMGRIGIDGLVQWEISLVVVVSKVQGRVSSWE